MSGLHEPLPKAIRRAAGDQNLTRSDIGRFLGLSHTTVGEWFSGKRTPTRDQLIELERILQVESGRFCVLAGYLPEGEDPKVEKTENGLVVRLSTLGLHLLYITWNDGEAAHGDAGDWFRRPIDVYAESHILKAA